MIRLWSQHTHRTCSVTDGFLSSARGLREKSIMPRIPSVTLKCGIWNKTSRSMWIPFLLISMILAAMASPMPGMQPLLSHLCVECYFCYFAKMVHALKQVKVLSVYNSCTDNLSHVQARTLFTRLKSDKQTADLFISGNAERPEKELLDKEPDPENVKENQVPDEVYEITCSICNAAVELPTTTRTKKPIPATYPIKFEDNNYQPTENEDESDESEEEEGESYDTEEPFREWFARIGELRSLCPNASMAALNATSGLIQRRKTIKLLCFRAHSEVIFDSPDRENIKISSLCIPNKDNLEKSVYLVDRHSKKQKEKTERHIIFCESIAEQMGRAGRDGEFSNELILYKNHKSHLKKVKNDLVIMAR
ncbi:recQ [Mytilus edulis]|uniref:RecQ n=1 Tax=Mytilus edulis TaxID=6550 RepID=A0A8S3SD26_MYTED|nr:recQ [Mytilus edulis]